MVGRYLCNVTGVQVTTSPKYKVWDLSKRYTVDGNVATAWSISTKLSYLPGNRLSRGLSGGTRVFLCSGWEAWWFPPPGRASSLCWQRFPTGPDCTRQTHCSAASELSSHTHSSPPLQQGAAHAGQGTYSGTNRDRDIYKMCDFYFINKWCGMEDLLWPQYLN